MCSHTPRFSYAGPETGVHAGSLVVHGGVQGRGVPVGYGDWVGTGGGYTGVLPSHPAPREEDPADSGAGPGSSCRELEWVVCRVWTRDTGGRSGPPFGPGRSPPGSPPCPSLTNAASGPIGARLRLHFSKVSQNDEVSPENVYKASHSPCFQNGSQKSALDFLGFPFLRAFSHKELIGLF